MGETGGKETEGKGRTERTDWKEWMERDWREGTDGEGMDGKVRTGRFVRDLRTSMETFNLISFLHEAVTGAK